MRSALEKRLASAEQKQLDLKTRMVEIDHELGKLTPADPKRVGLKAEKAEILPRYRGVKTHVKNLRRQLNSMPKEMLDVEPDEEEDVLRGAYEFIGWSLESFVIARDEQRIEQAQDFMDWFEHRYETESS